MLPDQLLGWAELVGSEPAIVRKFDRGLNPKLRLAVRVLHVNMQPRLLPREEIEAVPAGAGYYHGAEIKRCLEAGLTPLVPRPITSANAKRGLFTKDDFVYDRTRDLYRCPAGQTLSYRTTTVELGRSIKNYRTRACVRCALRPRCTRNKDGRKITRWVDEHLLEDMERRLQRERALFAQRKSLAEHPFGTMKRAMDQGYFLLKGLPKVRGEFSLTVLAYNLKRVLNLVGVPRLLDAVA